MSSQVLNSIDWLSPCVVLRIPMYRSQVLLPPSSELEGMIMKLLREELSGVQQQTSARRQSELYPAMQDFSSSQDVNSRGKALNPNIPKFSEFVTCRNL
jgi:hypothetical protein